MPVACIRLTRPDKLTVPLPKLTAEDLISIGVTSVGHRRKLLGAIAGLGMAVPTAAVMAAAPGAPVLASQSALGANFLATEKDWATLRAGVRLVREIGRQTPLASWRPEKSLPAQIAGPTRPSTHVRATSITVHRPLGTCRMELRRDRRLLECWSFR